MLWDLLLKLLLAPDSATRAVELKAFATALEESGGSYELDELIRQLQIWTTASELPEILNKLKSKHRADEAKGVKDNLSKKSLFKIYCASRPFDDPSLTFDSSSIASKISCQPRVVQRGIWFLRDAGYLKEVRVPSPRGRRATYRYYWQ